MRRSATAPPAHKQLSVKTTQSDIKRLENKLDTIVKRTKSLEPDPKKQADAARKAKQKKTFEHGKALVSSSMELFEAAKSGDPGKIVATASATVGSMVSLLGVGIKAIPAIGPIIAGVGDFIGGIIPLLVTNTGARQLSVREILQEELKEALKKERYKILAGKLAGQLEQLHIFETFLDGVSQGIADGIPVTEKSVSAIVTKIVFFVTDGEDLLEITRQQIEESVQAFDINAKWLIETYLLADFAKQMTLAKGLALIGQLAEANASYAAPLIVSGIVKVTQERIKKRTDAVTQWRQKVQAWDSFICNKSHVMLTMHHRHGILGIGRTPHTGGYPEAEVVDATQAVLLEVELHRELRRYDKIPELMPVLSGKSFFRLKNPHTDAHKGSVYLYESTGGFAKYNVAADNEDQKWKAFGLSSGGFGDSIWEMPAYQKAAARHGSPIKSGDFVSLQGQWTKKKVLCCPPNARKFKTGYYVQLAPPKWSVVSFDRRFANFLGTRRTPGTTWTLSLPKHFEQKSVSDQAISCLLSTLQEHDDARPGK